MSVARRGCVALDCQDPAALASFWAGMLGGEVIFASPTFVALRTDWIIVTAQQVADHQPPTWPEGGTPKQMHLDLAVDDLEQAVRDAEALGARSAPVQPSPDRWRVLVDPAGHPFCLTTLIPA
jgi:hypothetical protein